MSRICKDMLERDNTLVPGYQENYPSCLRIMPW